MFKNIPDEELKKELISNFEKFKILVLLKDEKIVGYLAYEFKGKRTKKMHIDQLIITEKERKHGYGKKLMKEANNIAKENNCDRIELDCWCFNTNALSMYEHIGFERQRILYEMKL